MRWFVLLLGAMHLALLLAAPAQAVESLEDRRERSRADVAQNLPLADAALAEKNFDRAIDLYTKVINSNAIDGSDLGLVLFKRGLAYQAKGDCVHAVQDYDKASDTLKTNGDLYFNRSLCQANLQHPDLALADLDRAVKANPDSVEYRTARCISLFNRHDFAGSLPDCDIALNKAPDDKGLLLAVSQAAEQTGDKAKATKAYRHLLELDPGNKTAQEGLKRLGG
jgi:tetratricopeptide (TPR) repeat protein